MKNTYLLKLKELKFSFNPQELIDYQFLLSLYYEINQSPFWDELKEEVYENLEILINVYNIDEINYSRKLTKETLDLNNINELSTYIYIFIELYKDMGQNNFNISMNNIEIIKNILILVEKELNDENVQEEIVLSSDKNTNNSCVHNCLICTDKCYSQEEDKDIKVEVKDEYISVPSKEEQKIVNFETHILNNHRINPNYLKEFLIRKNKIEYKCNRCGLVEWQNEPLLLYLNYKDYNPQNQNLDNLEFLCPNCYSQVGI